MESQNELFHDDINDAIGSLILALGGYKKVAADLWPHMAMNSAYARLKACLRDDKDEKLSPHELIYLIKEGRDKGCHAVINYICGEAGYEQPKALQPHDELAELQRQYIQAAKIIRAVSERIERINIREVNSG